MLGLALFYLFWPADFVLFISGKILKYYIGICVDLIVLDNMSLVQLIFLSPSTSQSGYFWDKYTLAEGIPEFLKENETSLTKKVLNWNEMNLINRFIVK